MDGNRASDEVIDEIAHIAMLRHDAQRHGGFAASGGDALRKLHELRDREQKALQQGENAAEHQANLEALAIEIRKVQQMTGSAGRHSENRNARPPRPQQQQARKEGGGGGGGSGGGPGGHNPSRNKGRRSMGRQNRP